VVVVVVVVALALCLAEGAQITSLPGYEGPELSMYTGYVNVNKAHNRNLFYWLIESQGNPSTDPLVVWLQGGPGCSSLGGLFTENGPLTPLVNGSVGYFGLGWTQYANMLYVESPAGVGFSYSDDPRDYNTNDLKTAEDNYAFLEGFLQTFPQYQGREFWITGESYAGVYVPMLVDLILLNKSSSIYNQLKGLMIGNPLLSCESSSPLNKREEFEIFYWHGLVSYSLYADWVHADCYQNYDMQECQDLWGEALSQVGQIVQEVVVGPPSPSPLVSNFPSLDPDCLYQDFCTGNGTLQFSLHTPEGCDPVGNELTSYLNTPSVQAAIAAKPVVWNDCSDQIVYYETHSSMTDLLLEFPKLKPNISMLVYSGDVDVATVPFPKTQLCLAEMKRALMTAWSPWYVNGATAGYVEVYDTYTYATIKGAGHEAPQYQPLSANNMFSRFLQNGNLND